MIESKIKLFILEVNKLKLNHFTISEIERDIREKINDIVVNAVSSAIDEFSSMSDSEEPLKHIELREMSGYPQLVSDTGSFDFNSSSYSMLPALLKNAKVSREGFRYKVIPIGKSSDKPNESVKSMSSGISSMRENPPSMENITAGIASSFNSGASRGEEKKHSVGSGGKQEFRTASEKQNMSSSWMMPSKEVSIDFEIVRINNNIISELEREVQSILDSKLEEIDV